MKIKLKIENTKRHWLTLPWVFYQHFLFPFGSFEMCCIQGRSWVLTCFGFLPESVIIWIFNYRIQYVLFFLRWITRNLIRLGGANETLRVSCIFNSALVLLMEKVFSIWFPAKYELLRKDFRYWGSLPRMTLTKVKLFWILNRTIDVTELLS